MLDRKLADYSKSNRYPFHMPGHKRALTADWDPYAIDITEIDGFDNLHHASGILSEAQRRAAKLYGAKESFYLINGSTCGILAAVSAAVPRGGRILVARNCHKSVYHAMYLRELTPVYLYPEITEDGICCAIRPEMVSKALAQQNDIAAVLLTSPTYDGLVSDVAGIAAIAHAHGIPLIVDEAHGAHFSLSGHFPQSAVSLGADVVIMSLHKTLPSFTQTALLHLCSDRVSRERIAHFLGIYETSSPSYILMAGMERCIRMMQEDGEALFAAYARRLDDFYDRVRGLKRLRVLTERDFVPEHAYAFDRSKLLIAGRNAGISGSMLHHMLLEEYGLQMEMAAGGYVLAMTSVMDSDEGFGRLAEALFAIDASDAAGERELMAWSRLGEIYGPMEQVLGIARAQDGASRMISLADAEEEVAASYLYLYPPGVPILAPGERITKKTLRDIADCREMGLEIHGLVAEDGIKVVILP